MTLGSACTRKSGPDIFDDHQWEIYLSRILNICRPRQGPPVFSRWHLHHLPKQARRRLRGLPDEGRRNRTDPPGRSERQRQAHQLVAGLQKDRVPEHPFRALGDLYHEHGRQRAEADHFWRLRFPNAQMVGISYPEVITRRLLCLQRRAADVRLTKKN